jgi:hypothetical protein
MEESRNNNDPKKAAAEAPRKTQAELDAESKRRAVAGSARAPMATSVDRSAAALASRQAVERNMEDRDILSKRRAAARDGPAMVAGVVSSSSNKPEPTLPPAQVETAASVGATTVRQPGTFQAAEENVETNQKIPARSSANDNSHKPTEVMAVASHAVAPVASLDHQQSVAGAEAVDIPMDVEKGFDESLNDKEGVEVSHEATVTPVPRSTEDEAVEQADVYPGLDAALLDNVVADVDAFVADTIVDATAVAVVMSEEEEEQFEQKRRKKYLCYGAIVCLIVALAVVVPVGIVVGGRSDNVIVVENPPSIAPTETPSAMPSSSPTSNLFSQFLDYLRTLSTSPVGLGNDTSAPQYMAAKWLVDDDAYSDSLLMEDSKTLQRYALATLYYATGGDNWKLCGKDSLTCGDTVWLTATDECEWFNLECEGGTITQISFGKKHVWCIVATQHFLDLSHRQLTPLFAI